MEKDQSLDILGIKPISNAVEKTTSKTLDGASAFLSRICLPVAEEFGLLLRDEVSAWRARRAITLAQKAEEKVKLHHGETHVTAQPRIVHNIFEEGSWIDDEIVHNMWAGLLASSCKKDGGNDSSILFIGLLKQLTALQVEIIRFAVENTNKYITNIGLPFAEPIECSVNKIKEVCRTDDLIRIDRELDHLRSLDLIGEGFDAESDMFYLEPRPLALNLYVRGEGFPGTVIEFWQLKKRTISDKNDT